MNYLSEIWVVGKNGYSSERKAKEHHPDKQPKLVIYQDEIWPAPHTPGGEAGPVSYRIATPKETLRTVLENAWESWEQNGNK